jgi:hypothetical protein
MSVVEKFLPQFSTRLDFIKPCSNNSFYENAKRKDIGFNKAGRSPADFDWRNH